jgi:hypothetical protein
MAFPFKRRDVIGIVVTVLILLVAVLVPALGRAKQKAARISCVCHLKQVGLAFRIYANDNADLYPMSLDSKDPGVREDALAGRVFRIFQVMSNELSVPKTLICPADSRRAASNWAGLPNTNISYFVGLDATDTKPNMVLTGDRNLVIEGKLLSGVVALGTNSPLTWTKEMHRDSGNIGLADGSVQQVTTDSLRQQLRNSGDSTNLLVFPQ